MEDTVSPNLQDGNPQHPIYDQVPYHQKMTIRERFWSNVEKTQTCWIWKASKQVAGYGAFSIRHKVIPAHRFSYELHYGPVPEGLWVLHKCDVRDCVRPDHLFLGTPADNTKDMWEKGRNVSPFTYHPESRPRGENHYQAKLTAEQVLQIREMATHYNPSQLARMFGVKRESIRDILSRKTWKHI